MRAQGVSLGPGSAAQGDHVCWVYDDEDSLAGAAREYLSEGLARGERLLCIGDTIAATLGDFPGLENLLARGALEILDVSTAYARAGALRPDQQLEFYETATRRAVAEGFTGLRVVADMTEIAADAELRGRLLEWEHVADDFIGSGSGMTALCAYAGLRLAPDALVDLTSAHPMVHAAEAPPFRLWFDDDVLTLAGEVDVLGAERLGRVLACSPARSPVVVLDLGRVEFMDVSGCRAIARWAVDLQDRGARLVLLGASRLFRRMWTVLGFAEATGALLANGDGGTNR